MLSARITMKTLPKTLKMPGVYLKPGEVHLARLPTVIQTVLGSCVSVTFYNARFSVAAICHALLPKCKEGNVCSEDGDVCFRYVDCAVVKMLEEFDRLGIPKKEIEAKIFGGSNMFESGNPADESRLVGNQNIEMALNMLEGAGIQLKTTDVGGRQGRKLFFYSHTGEVFVKRLRKIEFETSYK